MSRHLCSEPSCGYRRLYEGAQSSLSDMAARHSEALGRNGRLRQAIIMTLKQTFPQAFSKAEQGLGKRFHSVDDEVLVAYLQGFLSSSPEQRTEPGAGLEELRGALASVGVSVPPGGDLSAWARAIAASAHNHPVTSDRQAPPPPDALSTEKPSPTTQQGTVSEDPFSSLFEGASHSDAADSASSGSKEAVTDDPFDSLWEADTAPKGSADPATKAKEQDAVESISEPSEAGPTTTDDPFAGLMGQVEPDNTDSPPARKDDPFESLWSPDTSDAAPSEVTSELGARPGVSSLVGDGLDIDELFSGDEDVPAAPDVTQDMEVSGDEDTISSSESDLTLEDLFASVEEISLEDLFTQAAGSGETVSPTETTEEVREDAAPQERTPVRRNGTTLNSDGPLRPQLLISPPTRTTGRTVRRGRDEQDLPGSAVQPVGQEVHDRLLAATQVSRPVFTSDLVSLVGAEQVADWEATCRSDTHSPVRFIPPKGRHKLRGSLVLPVALADAPTPEFKTSVWAAVMDAYRGAKLYEVAVLLHRLSENVISHQVAEHTLTLRLAEPRGMTGVVVSFAPELPSGSAARADLADKIEHLMAERLTLVAALTTQSAAIERVSDALLTESKARGWQPLMPVVAATSWEYADSRGSTFKAVLGT